MQWALPTPDTVGLVRMGGPAGKCLAAVPGTAFHGWNDMLDARRCNASEPAQQWRFNNSSGHLVFGGNACTVGGPNWCKCGDFGKACCVDVNNHQADLGTALQGEACGASVAAFAPVPSGTPGEVRLKLANTAYADRCMAYTPLAPPPPPAPKPPPGVLTINPERMRAALEPLLLKYRVDATFVGHNHNYERTHAVANLTVVSRGEPRPGGTGAGAGRVYDRPGAPIHWVVGSGGADPNPTSAWKNKSAVPWPHSCTTTRGSRPTGAGRRWWPTAAASTSSSWTATTTSAGSIRSGLPSEGAGQPRN